MHQARIEQRKEDLQLAAASVTKRVGVFEEGAQHACRLSKIVRLEDLAQYGLGMWLDPGMTA